MVLFLVACTLTKSAGTPDADGDGYLSVADGGADCDDADPAVHPDAAEVCDEAAVDEDCDGGADDEDPEGPVSGGVTVWTDDDDDGYGAGDSRVVCEVGDAVAEQAGDCDDARADVHPGATEVCDPLNTDEDCNGAADDADGGLDADTRGVYYVDEDGDGYGVDEERARCDGGDGWAEVPGDCDDDRAEVNPGAQEVCSDPDADEDCDGLVDDDDPSVDASGGELVYSDDDGDGYGGGTGQLVCDARGGEVVVGGDCDDGDPLLTPADEDGDTYSPCDGDCADHDPGLSPEDGDGDGVSGCDGDCADDDPTVTEGCAYTALTGAWTLVDTACAYDVVGTPGDGSACPSCDFTFDTVHTLTIGRCLSTADVDIGYTAADGLMNFILSGAYELGPLDAWVITGGDYDRLYFDDLSANGYTYQGVFYLY